MHTIRIFIRNVMFVYGETENIVLRTEESELQTIINSDSP